MAEVMDKSKSKGTFRIKAITLYLIEALWNISDLPFAQLEVRGTFFMFVER